MFKFITVVLSTLLTCVAVSAGVVAPIAYANAPLYAPGGSSQIDIRNNYDGTISSYTTVPFNYAGPVASRYVSGFPLAAPIALAAPLTAPLSNSFSFVGSPSVAKYVAPTAFATPFASPFATQAIVPSPLAAPFTAPARLVL